MASFNESLSILIGGESTYDSYLPLTWFYDHSTEEFKPGPELLEGRILHSAGKFLDKRNIVLFHSINSISM